MTDKKAYYGASAGAISCAESLRTFILTPGDFLDISTRLAFLLYNRAVCYNFGEHIRAKPRSFLLCTGVFSVFCMPPPFPLQMPDNASQSCPITAAASPNFDAAGVTCGNTTKIGITAYQPTIFETNLVE